MGRKKDAAYLRLKSKLLETDFTKWDTNDIETTDVKDQRKVSDDDVSLAKSLDFVSNKDPAEPMEDVANVLDDKEASGLKEEVMHQGIDSHEFELGNAIGEVVMESIPETADEDTVETASVSLNYEEQENEKAEEHQIQTDYILSEVVIEEKVNNYNVADEEEPTKLTSTSTVDPKDQTRVDAHSDGLGEEESIGNIDVSDVIGEEEPVKLSHSVTNKTNEDQTKTGVTYSAVTIKEESLEFTVSSVEKKKLKLTMIKQPVETVSDTGGDEGPVTLPDTVTNESDEEQTKTKTGDMFSDATIKEESLFDELKPLATKNTDEDQSRTSVTFSETLFKMESVDLSFVVNEEKPINSTQIPTKDTDEEETKMDAYTEMVVQELGNTESPLGAHDGVKDKEKEKVKKEDIKEVMEDQVEKAVKKDNGKDPQNVESKDNVDYAQFHIRDYVIQTDDENNNNNDQKRQPVKRDHVRHGATIKETNDQEDDLHEENEKGIKCLSHHMKS